MKKRKQNKTISKLLENQEKRARLTSSVAEKLQSSYKFKNNWAYSLAEEMRRVQEQFSIAMNPVHEFLKSLEEPNKSIQSILQGIQPLVNSYQITLDLIDNNSLVSLTKSLQETLEPLHALKNFQKSFDVTDSYREFYTHKEIWENISDDDVDLQNAASILDDVREEKQSLEEAVDRLTVLVEDLASKPTTNEVVSLTRFEKISVLYMIITTLLISIPLIYPKSTDRASNEEAITKLTGLVGSLSGKYKETTVNVRLRTEPNTKNSKNILLVIPKGTVVLVHQSVNYWSNVMYTDSNGFVRSGWVSKRYLD